MSQQGEVRDGILALGSEWLRSQVLGFTLIAQLMSAGQQTFLPSESLFELTPFFPPKCF